MSSVCWLPTFGVTSGLIPTHPGSPHELLPRPHQTGISDGSKLVPSSALWMPGPGVGPGRVPGCICGACDWLSWALAPSRAHSGGGPWPPVPA